MPDEIGIAYGAWSDAHRELVDAELELTRLPLDAIAARRDELLSRIHGLRARSDELLTRASALLKSGSRTG